MSDPSAYELPRRLAARKQGNLFFLDLAGLLAFEAADRLTYLHHMAGTYSVDLSLNALAAALGSRVLRVHRNWLIAPDRVQGLTRLDGELCLELRADLRVPVARDRARQVRKRLLQDTLGLADA
jgi:DNA-binding LytR/AlgR family response regulator